MTFIAGNLPPKVFLILKIIYQIYLTIFSFHKNYVVHRTQKLFKEQSILSDINGLLNWDMATYMPSNSRSQRVDQIKTIYDYKKRIFEIIKQKELFKKISSLKLNKIDQQNLDLMQSKFNYFNWIPSKLIEKKLFYPLNVKDYGDKQGKKNSFNIVKNKLYELIKIVKERIGNSLTKKTN